jgi:hypothetical protein
MLVSIRLNQNGLQLHGTRGQGQRRRDSQRNGGLALVALPNSQKNPARKINPVAIRSGIRILTCMKTVPKEPWLEDL